MSSNLIEQNAVVLREVKVGDRNLNINCIVLENEQTVTTKDGNLIKNFRIADRTGSMTLSLWDEQIGSLAGGEIVSLQKAQSVVFRGCLQLNLMKGGSVTKRGEYCMLFLEMPFFSAFNPELEKLNSIGKIEPVLESAENGALHIGKLESSNHPRGAIANQSFGHSHQLNGHPGSHHLGSSDTGSARAISHDCNGGFALDRENSAYVNHQAYQEHDTKNMRGLSSTNGTAAAANSDYHYLPANQVHQNLSGPQHHKMQQRAFHNNNNIYQNNNYGNSFEQMKNKSNFAQGNNQGHQHNPRFPMGQNKWSNNHNRGRHGNYSSSNNNNSNHNSGLGKFKKSKFSSPNAPY